MTFDEALVQVRELLEREGRVAYRILKRRFALTDEDVEDVKADLIDAKRLVTDEDGKVLVWAGATPVSSSELRVSSSTQPPVPNTQPPEAERRQLTVMFCDLVGSTALSAQLDPEEWREVVRAYQHTSATVIERFDGHIAQYLGDGLLVYFGYPVAHEDDAARAVRTGLEIITTLQKQVPSLRVPSPLVGESLFSPSPFQGEGRGEGSRVAQLKDLPHPSPLPTGAREIQVRIGIHTGLVVVGEMGGGTRREQLALGEAPNIAARIQGQAEPDTVVISATTYRLVEGLFECEDCGQPALKGVSTPLTLYHVLKEGEAQSRFQVVARKGLTPLVGREHEYGLLRERWERVKDGAGQIVLLSGEPGIGKSRLVEALKDSLKHAGVSFLELRCSSYHQNSALYPVIEHVQRMLGFQSGDSLEEKLHKLEGGTRHVVSLQQEAIPLLASLLSLPQPNGYPPLSLSPQKQKEKTYEALVAWFCAETKPQAVTYAWEDLHWADPSTLELLTLFLEQVPTARLLAVLTFRPEFTPPWGAHSYLGHLTLSRLGRSHVETMVEKVTGGTPLPVEVIQHIVNKTDGVPLFVEELTKMVVEQNVGAYDNTPLLGIPATLHDALMARLDRLGPAKEIAQVGATIGREFAYELLQAVSSLTDETLHQGLRQLVEAELVYQNGRPPQATYLFKHALIQDTAYQSLLKSRRQQLHQQVAQVLAERFAETVETQPELIAHHYTEAGLIEQAIPYWQKAGTLAIKRLAFKEAIAHLNQGMTLIGTLPPSPERDGQELDLRTRLGMAWLGLKGWAAPEMWTSLHPALGLAKSLSRHDALLTIYWGLSEHVIIHGRVAESLNWVNEMLATAEARGAPDLLVVAHWMAGIVHFWRGDFAQARRHDDRVLALYDEDQHRHLADLINTDPKSDVGVHGSLGAWMQGYPDRAVEICDANDAHARRRGHPFDLGWVLTGGGMVWDCRYEPVRLLARAEEAERLGRAHSLPFISDVLAQIMKGIAWLRVGRFAEGIPQLRGAIETWNAQGGELWVPYWRAALAEGLTLNGDVVGGLQLIKDNLSQIERPGWGERWYLAEILRLKGWMLSLQGDFASAEQQYLASLDVAREQQAKSWELRTSTSLARLWQQQGRQKEAHQMLAEIYGWFTEGFDTKDLQEAKTLLDSLGSREVVVAC
jgi:class 3 adenylate cyclase/predicted ATPase